VVRLRLDIAYDGTEFSGWARQPDRRTVQGEIEAALGRVLRLDSPPQLTVAGRTDAGVHARGQVAHVDLPASVLGEPEPGEGAESPRTAERLAELVRRLAGVLPPDIRIYRLTVAPEGFDARFSAIFRRYAYRVCDDPAGVDPLRRREVLWHNRPLDVARMNEAAVHLLGEHDFAAFCRKRAGATTIRELRRLEWAEEDPRPGEGRAGGRIITATVVADAFCHSMVRALVGALLAVGDGRRPVDWPGRVLAAGVRDPGVNVAPAHGLCLEEVGYPPDDELARRAAQTRRVRTLTAS